MVTTIDSVLAQIPLTPAERFIPTRYPYTYAADLLRQQPQIVPGPVQRRWDAQGLPPGLLLSRSESSRIRQMWAEYEGCEDAELAVLLADVYLRVHGITKPED